MPTFRDLFLKNVLLEMRKNNNIFFLTADFGAPALDEIKQCFPERYINVGVAEQNMVNTAVGLAKEGAIVYCFAIAPFITMRCFEQLRTCVSVFGKYKPLNINFIGVGAGVSYDMSGPTHHCFEDLAITNMLPRFEVFSPSDGSLITSAFSHSIKEKNPLYLRFDSKALQNLECFSDKLNFKKGLRKFGKGKTNSVILSTGYATHVASELVEKLGCNIDIVDVFLFGEDYKKYLAEEISSYKNICTVFEGFKWSGGLDTYALSSTNIGKIEHFESIGFDDYCFQLGKRQELWENAGNSTDAIIKTIENFSS